MPMIKVPLTTFWCKYLLKYIQYNIFTYSKYMLRYIIPSIVKLWHLNTYSHCAMKIYSHDSRSLTHKMVHYKIVCGRFVLKYTLFTHSLFRNKYTNGKQYGIFGKHTGHIRIWLFDLFEMVSHQSQTGIVTLMQLSRLMLWTKNAICNFRKWRYTCYR